MIVCSFANKGGVGKTTILREFICFTIQKSLKQENFRPKKILLLDADSQRNLTDFCYSDMLPESKLPSWFPCIKDPTIEIRPYNIMDNDRLKIDFMTSSDEDPEVITNLAETFSNSIKVAQFHKFMKTFFNSMRGKYDLICIDLSPSLNTLNKSIIALSDEVVVTVLSDEYSKSGCIKLMDFLKEPVVKKLKGDGPLVKIAGFITNMIFRADPTAHDKKITEQISKLLNSATFLGFLPEISNTDKGKWKCILTEPAQTKKVDVFQGTIGRLYGYCFFKREARSVIKVKNDKFKFGDGSEVYVIQQDSREKELNKKFKIGHGTDRLVQLQVGNPEDLTYLHKSVEMSKENAFCVEHYLHKLFSKNHYRNEWFVLSDSDLDQLKKLLDDKTVCKNIILKEKARSIELDVTEDDDIEIEFIEFSLNE